MAAVKALQQWCRVQCEGYRDVSITNMTTSFRDGLAFCALIHRHRPELIDFNSLKKEDVYENNHLAFSVAEQQLGIPALLDAEDMVALRVPDRLSILTYVSQYYNYFHGRSPIGGMAGVKRPAEGATEQQPAGKKNQPVSAKVFPSSGPTKENHPPADYSRPASTQAPSHTNNKQDVPVRSPQTGTLSNRCVSCNKHVHLVQRQLVDGKLYHRNCAKTLTPNAYTAELHKKLSLSRLTPDPDPTKTGPRDGPTWLTHKASTPSSVSGNSAPVNASKPNTSSTVSSYVSPPKTSAPAKTNIVSRSRSPHSAPVNDSKPAAPYSLFSTVSPPQLPKPAHVNVSTSVSPPQPANPTPAKTNITSIFPLRPVTSTPINISKSGTSSESTTTTVSATPVAAPRTSIAAKNLQAKLKFFQSNDADSDREEKSKKMRGVEGVPGQQEETAPAAHSVTVLVHLGGKDRDLDKSSVALEKEAEQSRAKASAAAFISKKLTEENNNKPAWTVTPKTQNKWTPAEAPKKEPEGVRGRVKLRANPSLLSDLNISSTTGGRRSPSPVHTRSTAADRRSPSPVHTRSTAADRRSPSPVHTRSTAADRRSPSPVHTRSTAADRRSPSPVHTRSTGTRAPDRGAQKPRSPSPNTSAGPQSETPSDWRALLKPVSKDSRSPALSQSSSKPWTNGSGQTWTPEPFKPGSGTAMPSISVTPPAPKGFTSSPRDTTGPEALTKNTKTKPDYIPKEEILKELQQIEDSLNELERTGVDLELKLRTSEENGEDESVMNELMVEWFTLIRNKQLAMRRESELVYIGRTQELEEEQPSVEQELRRLLEKPEHLKTTGDQRKQKELMDKLLEIVNDRNAIVEGLDEDRLREGEEDEQLNQLMLSFNLKKDKSKKKSPMSKLFSWGSKDT